MSMHAKNIAGSEKENTVSIKVLQVHGGASTVGDVFTLGRDFVCWTLADGRLCSRSLCLIIVFQDCLKILPASYSTVVLRNKGFSISCCWMAAIVFEDALAKAHQMSLLRGWLFGRGKLCLPSSACLVVLACLFLFTPLVAVGKGGVLDKSHHAGQLCPAKCSGSSNHPRFQP